jgi:hypothetical protein
MPFRVRRSRVVPVLIEDRAFPLGGVGSRDPGLDEDLLVGDRLAGVLPLPLGDLIRDLGDPGADDELQSGILEVLEVLLAHQAHHNRGCRSGVIVVGASVTG